MNSESKRRSGFVPFQERPNVRAAIEQIRAIEPKVVFDVYFGEHDTQKQGRALASKIRTCDLFIPEGAGWDQREVQRYNDVSQGIANPHSLDLFEVGKLQALRNKKKSVKFIDFPFEHPSYEKLDELYFWHAPAEIIAPLQDERDEYMMEQLPQVLSEFIDENPTLVKRRQKQDKPIKTLLFLGAIHTRIYHALKEANPQSTKTVIPKPFVFDEGNTYIRETFFGKNTE